MKKSFKSEFFIILAGVLWGLISIFKNMLGNLMLSEITVVFVRLFVATVLFGVFILFKDKKLLKIRLSDIWCFIGTGIISLFLFSWCYFLAMSKTSVGVAVTLLYTSPIFVTVMSVIFFKEKLTTKKIIYLFLAIFGCIMVTELFTQNLEIISMSGVVLGIMSGFFYALYSIFGKLAIKKNYNSYTITFYTTFFALIPSFFLFDFSEITPCLGNMNFWIGSLGIGLICCVMPYLFYTKGLLGVSGGKASVLAAVEPVVGTLAGIILFNENMTAYKLFGMILILLCTIILSKEI